MPINPRPPRLVPDSPVTPRPSSMISTSSSSGDHEREPAEDRGLAMARAPAAHPGRQVV
jgi:hypothetical protein